jgi:hypothetical protein
MKKLFIIVVLSIGIVIQSFSQFSNEFIKTNLPRTYQKILENSIVEWGNDYEMRNYFVEKQVNALNEFLNLIRANEFNKDIRNICVTALSNWCKNNLVTCSETTPKLIDGSTDLDAVQYCADVDWEMALYEANKQIAAYRNFNYR